MTSKVDFEEFPELSGVSFPDLPDLFRCERLVDMVLSAPDRVQISPCAAAQPKAEPWYHITKKACREQHKKRPVAIESATVPSAKSQTISTGAKKYVPEGVVVGNGSFRGDRQASEEIRANVRKDFGFGGGGRPASQRQTSNESRALPAHRSIRRPAPRSIVGPGFGRNVEQ